VHERDQRVCDVDVVAMDESGVDSDASGTLQRVALDGRYASRPSASRTQGIPSRV
jgi:hypothetical protein